MAEKISPWFNLNYSRGRRCSSQFCQPKMDNQSQQKKCHFVLVHGACHGAWCWYKVETLLKEAGHRVTSLDMASCGVNPTQYLQIKTVSDYFEPLTKFMESVEERVIVVAHSYAGLGLCMVMEMFPQKIAVAVFVSALMAGPKVSFVDLGREKPMGGGPDMDNQFEFLDGPDKPPTSFIFGPKFLSANVYQLCSPEDFTLATKLLRTVSLKSFESMSEEVPMTEEKYGTVRRAYVITGADKLAKFDFQHYMVENNPPDIVKEIQGCDHMVMLSKSHDLYVCLQEIAEYFS